MLHRALQFQPANKQAVLFCFCVCHVAWTDGLRAAARTVRCQHLDHRHQRLPRDLRRRAVRPHARHPPQVGAHHWLGATLAQWTSNTPAYPSIRRRTGYGSRLPGTGVLTSQCPYASQQAILALTVLGLAFWRGLCASLALHVCLHGDAWFNKLFALPEMEALMKNNMSCH